MTAFRAQVLTWLPFCLVVRDGICFVSSRIVAANSLPKLVADAVSPRRSLAGLIPLQPAHLLGDVFLCRATSCVNRTTLCTCIFPKRGHRVLAKGLALHSLLLHGLLGNLVLHLALALLAVYPCAGPA